LILGAADLVQLISRCSSHVSAHTMYAIIQTETHGNPLAINLNGGIKLKSQPSSYAQARLWADYLEAHSYNLDVGLAQVNISNVHKFGYHARDMLNPCTNLKIASKILYLSYRRAYTRLHNQQVALINALSAYNSGNYSTGMVNGYVKRVLINGKAIEFQ